MTLQLEDKVAVITGAARGQGRSHAVRFADEGADIIAFDLCEQIDSVAYLPLVGEKAQEVSAFVDAVDVMLTGVYFTIEAALPALLAHGDGGAIVITSSTAGLTGVHARFNMKNHGGAGYIAAKHGVVGLMRGYANMLAEKNIRVNTVHPTGLASPMIVNEQIEQLLAEQPQYGRAFENHMPVPVIEASDISDAMVYLCGRSGRYITGVTCRSTPDFAPSSRLAGWPQPQIPPEPQQCGHPIDAARISR